MPGIHTIYLALHIGQVGWGWLSTHESIHESMQSLWKLMPHWFLHHASSSLLRFLSDNDKKQIWHSPPIGVRVMSSLLISVIILVDASDVLVSAPGSNANQSTGPTNDQERRSSDTTGWTNPFGRAWMPWCLRADRQSLACLLGWNDAKEPSWEESCERRGYISFKVRPCVRQLTPKQQSRTLHKTHQYHMYVDETDISFWFETDWTDGYDYLASNTPWHS